MTHRRDVTTDAGRRPPRFITALATDAETVRQAQRLRYRIFHAASASDAALPDPGRLDEDAYDAHCEHLVVRDTTTGAVVGTYRILPAERAAAAGGFYSEREFDCARLLRLDARLVEVGRACVDPAHRSGGVIALLLAALTRYVVARRWDYVMGCASVDLARHGVERAATLARRLVAEHLGPDDLRVVPHVPFRPGAGPFRPGDPPARDVEPPPLIRAYLRFGASVCGDPAWDAELGTVDFLMLLPMATMDPRFRARLTREEPGLHDPAAPARGRTPWAA
jgi:putative hemolysin